MAKRKPGPIEPGGVDEYISTCPVEAQEKPRTISAAIREVAPGSATNGDSSDRPGNDGGGRQRMTGSRVFTREELLRCDGKEGRPAYVSYGGLVFDVSRSSLWKEGRHQNRHDAGRDLTAEFKAAPHSTSILLRLPVVGRLKR